jgi:hypothetical protein
MRAVRLPHWTQCAPELIDWLNQHVGHPGLSDTWRFIRVGPIKFIAFSKAADGMMFKLTFADSHEIEVLDEEDETRLFQYEVHFAGGEQKCAYG